jgi:hypothetical protein
MRVEEKKEENVIEIPEEIEIKQEDGSVVILEAGDKISVIESEDNEKE